MDCHSFPNGISFASPAIPPRFLPPILFAVRCRVHLKDRVALTVHPFFVKRQGVNRGARRDSGFQMEWIAIMIVETLRDIYLCHPGATKIPGYALTRKPFLDDESC